MFAKVMLQIFHMRTTFCFYLTGLFSVDRSRSDPVAWDLPKKNVWELLVKGFSGRMPFVSLNQQCQSTEGYLIYVKSSCQILFDLKLNLEQTRKVIEVQAHREWYGILEFNVPHDTV